MRDFERKLITEWRRLDLPTSGESLIIGVSGGADSVSLLVGLDELRRAGKLELRLVAAHFNHRLRNGDSDADEAFVKELTTTRKIELAVGHAREKLEGSDLEQKARNARYNFLRGTAEAVGAYAILTGHTINDQAETFLINLLRGSGREGLCGIKPIRPMDDEAPPKPDGCEVESDAAEGPMLFPTKPLLVRPLLTWAKRKHTEGYCHELGIDYRYDTMNEDTAFKRVRIRKILLPLLEDFNPNIVETLANTASLMQRLPAQNIQDDHADELDLSDLSRADEHDLYARLRVWLARKRGTPRGLGLKHIQAVERLIKSRRSGRIVEVPGGRVVKSGGRLRFEENKVENAT